MAGDYIREVFNKPLMFQLLCLGLPRDRRGAWPEGGSSSPAMRWGIYKSMNKKRVREAIWLVERMDSGLFGVKD